MYAHSVKKEVYRRTVFKTKGIKNMKKTYEIDKKV